MKDERYSTALADLASPETIVVIPCLNEEKLIGSVIESVLPFAERQGALIIAADGGSDDRTREIITQYAERSPHVRLLLNPGRIQSAGINLAVSLFGQHSTYLIRIDAHCTYPPDYCDTLLAEAWRTGADSVVVSMIAEGNDPLQRVTAAAQNSRIGNGGSRHRMRSDSGEYVDHGHHALMRLDAFRAVGGYDNSFACNEDAELDVRLGRAGYHIWLTSETTIAYHPRRTFGQLFRQYVHYGQGRAQNLMKHPILPKLRQAVLLGVFPALLLALLMPLTVLAAVPLALWVIACIVGGVAIALRNRNPFYLLSGVSAGVMHLAWSYGFWRELVTRAFSRSAARDQDVRRA